MQINLLDTPGTDAAPVHFITFLTDTLQHASGQVQTQALEPVTILTTEALPDRPIIGIVTRKNGTKSQLTWTANGKYLATGNASKSDLMIVPNPPKSLGWRVVFAYDSGTVATSDFYSSLEDLRNAVADYQWRDNPEEVFINPDFAARF